MSKLTVLLISLFMLLGCSGKNLRPMDLPTTKCVSNHNSICEMIDIRNNMAEYANGANLNSSTLNIIALGGAGVGAIGLATNSHSDLYKSAGAIIATSLGFKSWGNFDEQAKIYTSAYYKLACAVPYAEEIILKGEEIKAISASEAGATYVSSLTQKVNTEDLLPKDFQAFSAKTTSKNRTLSNKDLAKKITNSIIIDGPADAIKLQINAQNEVAKNSFKTEEAIKIIYNTAFEKNNFISDGEDTTGLSKLYTEVIKAKVEYLKCTQLSPNSET